MTDAAPAPGAAVTRAPDPSVVTAYRHLLVDARAVLESWPAPDADQERLRARLPRPPRGTGPTRSRRRGRRPTSRHPASCSTRPVRQVLLTLHRKANAWFQFGGHLEVGDPTLWAAARREAREESGIDTLEPLPRPVQLDRHTLVGSFGTCREHLDVRYAAVAPAGARARVSAESHDVRWWPVDALPEGTRAELAPLVSLARRALGFG